MKAQGNRSAAARVALDIAGKVDDPLHPNGFRRLGRIGHGIQRVTVPDHVEVGVVVDDRHGQWLRRWWQRAPILRRCAPAGSQLIPPRLPRLRSTPSCLSLR